MTRYISSSARDALQSNWVHYSRTASRPEISAISDLPRLTSFLRSSPSGEEKLARLFFRNSSALSRAKVSRSGSTEDGAGLKGTLTAGERGRKKERSFLGEVPNRVIEPARDTGRGTRAILPIDACEGVVGLIN